MAAADFKIPIICGPTASGKTSIAVLLAQKYPVEIISADSRQIIKYLDIGTAKPSPEERDKVKFHLIDIIEPGERYSAFQFIDDAHRLIKDIINRKNIPILVGGTGLYLYALTEGVVEIDQEDLCIREELEKELKEKGSEVMHKKLEIIDPLEAIKIHPNNHQRLIRALEIFYLTGKSKSELITTGSYRKSEFDFSYFCLAPERADLYEKINQRVVQMINAGLEDEINHLIKNSYKDKIRKANVIGYSEILDYLDDKYSYDEAIAMIKQNSRRYAKRQLTWFRKQMPDRMFADKASLIEQLDPLMGKLAQPKTD